MCYFMYVVKEKEQEKPNKEEQATFWGFKLPLLRLRG